MKNQLFIFSWILLTIVTLADCATATNDYVVARIGTNTFLRQDFRLSVKQGSLAYSDQSTNTLSSSDNLTEVQASQLAEWVIKKAASDMGITVSAEEQKVTLSQIYKNDNQALSNLTNMMQTLPVALRETLHSPEKEKEIYEKYLVHKMAYETWRGHLSRYNTEEKIASLERMALPTKNDLYQPMPSLEKILLMKKLRQKITQDISAKTNGLIQKDNLEEAKEKAWRDWVNNTLKSTDLLICDEALKSAYQKYVENEWSQKTQLKNRPFIEEKTGVKTQSSGNTGKP